MLAEKLKGRTKLEYLRLGKSKVTDAGLVHLKELSKLERLILDRTGSAYGRPVLTREERDRDLSHGR
ncbi:MAG: hypothetical protein QF752_06145 [Planctomycetota bacterium]|nr:hypothetical protein [Planctomycetota bacterium]